MAWDGCGPGVEGETNMSEQQSAAQRLGLTEQELVETIIHLAFSAGWPKAMSAIGVARDVFSA
jgi:alkylhydroperoxidase/carboxymuconolactone decarboxylase family protein YurZ